MPYKKPIIEKLLYSISEVADMFDVNISLIRFWEKEFDIIKPVKNKKGNRQFTPKDVENFRLIYHLVKEKGMTLKGAQKKLKDNKESTIHHFEIIKRLQNIKSELISIKEQLDI
jgi:DNA-binding transcriptional MerR regulator